MAIRKNAWKGGPRSSRSYKMDMMRKAKDEPETPGVRPHYRAKPKGGFTTVKWHHRRKKR